MSMTWTSLTVSPHSSHRVEGSPRVRASRARSQPPPRPPALFAMDRPARRLARLVLAGGGDNLRRIGGCVRWLLIVSDNSAVATCKYLEKSQGDRGGGALGRARTDYGRIFFPPVGPADPAKLVCELGCLPPVLCEHTAPARARALRDERLRLPLGLADEARCVGAPGTPRRRRARRSRPSRPRCAARGRERWRAL